ncbi:hypothetical protein [Streptomyces sp. NPDC058657]|uniref:hypothetical protein n=1 Tax=unclassified Streptomyces TaxID=2593676 RepID=UPI003648BDEF
MDWDQHVQAVDRAAIALPDDLAELPAQVSTRMESLATDDPATGVRAVRRLEVIAGRAGYEAARNAAGAPPHEMAPARGTSEEAARSFLARPGCWSVHSSAFENTAF